MQAADRLIANTSAEADELARLYDADPYREDVVHPRGGFTVFQPQGQPAARAQTARVECRIVDRMVVFAHDTATLPPVEDLDVAACADVGASRVAHRVDTAFVAAATPVSPPL